MRYRRLGRTAYMISEIVCGGNPITPTNVRHVEVAIEMGLNYLDTAPAYGDGESASFDGAKGEFRDTSLSPVGSPPGAHRVTGGADPAARSSIPRNGSLWIR